jgi:hypothetical protein
MWMRIGSGFWLGQTGIGKPGWLPYQQIIKRALHASTVVWQNSERRSVLADRARRAVFYGK